MICALSLPSSVSQTVLFGNSDALSTLFNRISQNICLELFTVALLNQLAESPHKFQGQSHDALANDTVPWEKWLWMSPAPLMSWAEPLADHSSQGFPNHIWRLYHFWNTPEEREQVGHFILSVAIESGNCL